MADRWSVGCGEPLERLLAVPARVESPLTGGANDVLLTLESVERKCFGEADALKFTLESGRKEIWRGFVVEVTLESVDRKEDL